MCEAKFSNHTTVDLVVDRASKREYNYFPSSLRGRPVDETSFQKRFIFSGVVFIFFFFFVFLFFFHFSFCFSSFRYVSSSLSFHAYSKHTTPLQKKFELGRIINPTLHFVSQTKEIISPPPRPFSPTATAYRAHFYYFS